MGGYQNVYLDDSSRIKNEKRVQYYIKEISKLAETYQIKDIFDAAGNSGVFAQALIEETPIESAIVMDLDEEAIESGYNRVLRNELINNKITFLLGNLIFDYNCKTRYKVRMERLNCDCVIALAVSHHILLTQEIRPSVFLGCIYELCRKIAIIEFMPYGLWSGLKEDLDKISVPDWYTLDWFTGEMKKFFKILKVEEVSENRIAVIGEKLLL